MRLVGLTGGIASGKTLVSDRFAAHGVPVIDADVLARAVVQPGTAGLNALITHFGTAILAANGELDRAALRAMIFVNPPDRAAVDAILHPRIRARADAGIEAARADGHAYAIYAVPLLIETGQQARVDRIAVVDVPADLQRCRLIERDGSNEDEADAILAAQATREERLAIADDVIDNSGPRENTLEQVDVLHVRYATPERRP